MAVRGSAVKLGDTLWWMDTRPVSREVAEICIRHSVEYGTSYTVYYAGRSECRIPIDRAFRTKRALLKAMEAS